MSIIFELTASVIQLFIWEKFVSDFLGYRYSGRKAVFGFVLTLLILVFEISVINYIIIYDGPLSWILALTMVVYALMYLKGSGYMRVFIPVFAFTMIFAANTVIVFIVSRASGFNIEYLIENVTIWRVLFVIICRLIEAVMFKGVLYLKDEYELTKREWLLFITLPVMTLAMTTFLTQAAIISEAVTVYMLLSEMVILAVDFLILYFFVKMKQDAKMRAELDILKLQYDNMKKNEETIKALYENTCSVKHDMEKHLLAVKAMAEADEKSGIANYVDKIVDEIEGRKIVFTKSDVFNAIVNSRLEICRQKGITIGVNISDDAVGCIKTEDMAVLFGNIFDNAIEAAAKTKEKRIVFYVQMRRGYVSVYIENSFDKANFDPALKTTKDDGAPHGFGIKNVRRIAQKYDGMIQFFENESGMFCCDILLKNNN